MQVTPGGVRSLGRWPRWLALAALALPAAAQGRTVEDEQIWLNATVMQTQENGFAWFAEVQPRFTEGAQHLRQLILRPAVGYRLSPAVTVYAGYAHVDLPRRGPDRNEDRFFAQLSWIMAKPGDATLSSRTRIEHRQVSSGDDVGWRARAMLRYVDPLGAPERTRLLVSAEGFVAFDDTDWGATAGFDQLRSFAGVEVPIGGRNTLELGYLNQFVNDPGGQERMNHVASAAIFIRL